jgi:lipopolysaccharide transport system permease protein
MRIEVDAKRWRWLPDLREFYAYRDLFLVLAYRDLQVRYAQTVLGIVWAVVQPCATLVVMTLVFGRAVGVDTSGIPYPLFAITGISAWTYFAFVMKESGGSLIASQEMVRKVYFPRLLVPVSKSAVGITDLVVALAVMVVLFFHYGMAPEPHIVLALFYLFGIMISALGVGIWVSALTIRYRDLQHVVPFAIQLGLFLTPVAYTAGAVTGNLPGWMQAVYFLNPMAGLIEGYRWCLLGVGDPGGWCWLSFVSSAVLLLSSFVYFRKMERVVADLL